MKTLFTVLLTLIFIIAASPAFAVEPPADKDLEWLRSALDLQQRIDFAKSTLEPLLNPSPDPVGVMEKFGNGLTRNFDLKKGEKNYIERYDLNSDRVIDERDFVEMAFSGDLMTRTANTSPTFGESKCVVLLIKFPDQDPDPAHDAAFFQNMFFGDQFLSTRSYYIQVSNQNLSVNGDVLTNPEEPDGYFMASHERAYYVDNGDLLGEILDDADPYYDFSLHDANGDTEVDGAYFIYAGNDTGWGSFYWGWATYGNYNLDGVHIGPLMFCGENLITYRVAAHELGHMMGLPDLYDYNFIDGVAWGVGQWSLMGKGEDYMCAWCRMKLGWADIIDVSVDAYNVKIYPQSLNSPSYRVWTNGMGGDEYFLVSYMKKVGYDFNLPGEGLMVWHVDETGNNSNWWHKLVDVEEADGNDDLDHFNNPGDVTDVYYIGNATTFNHDSYPNSDSYTTLPTGVSVLNVGALGGDFITADLIVGIPGDVDVDETEPNNTWDDSGVLNVLPPNGIFDGIVDNLNDPSDFWRYTAPSAGIIQADLISHNPAINLDLVLWDKNGAQILASSASTLPNEHLEFTVTSAGDYYLEIKPAQKSAYYDITASFKELPANKLIDIYGYDIMPPKVYSNTMTIPALRVSILKGMGVNPTLQQLRVYTTGISHYAALGAKLWLDNGDLTFGPGKDILLSGPEPFDPDSGSAIFSAINHPLGPTTELFVTLDLDDVSLSGGTIGLRMSVYKDIAVTEGLVQYHNFPLSSTMAMIYKAPMPLSYVAAGDFTMGSDPDNDPYYDPACDLNEETPVHLNRTGNYYISRYEISNDLFADFIAAGGYDTQPLWSGGGWTWKNDNAITAPNGWDEGEVPIGSAYPEYPVAGVSWFEAAAFAKWIGGRLPHETEWEKSGRGTDARLYTYGNTYDSSKYHAGYPAVPIHSYPEGDSFYGVADLHGNVFEWIYDGWQWGLYEKYASGNLVTPPPNSYCMQRGYSWLLAGGCGSDYASRLPYRDTWPRSYRWQFLGFRVAFNPPV